MPSERDRGADARVVVGLEREVADRVGVVGVEAERDDQRRIGVEGADGVEPLVEGGEVGVAIGPGRKGQVERRALTGATAALGGVAAEVRIDARRVAVEADVEHVGRSQKICCVPLP